MTKMGKLLAENTAYASGWGHHVCYRHGFLLYQPDFKFLSQIFPGHAIMNLDEGEGKILCYFSSLSFKIFKTASRKNVGGSLFLLS